MRACATKHKQLDHVTKHVLSLLALFSGLQDVCQRFDLQGCDELLKWTMFEAGSQHM